MDIIVNVLSWLSIIIGCFFLCAGGVGMIRLPDIYTRIHAASVTDTGGAAFIFIGLLLQAIFIFDNPMAAIKIILTAFFMFFTGPTASHALAKVALMAGVMPQGQGGQSVVDNSLELEQGGQGTYHE